MKDFETLVGKYSRVAEKYVAYFFPKVQKSRLREDDQEYVYWDEYMMLGGGYYNGTLVLFYDPLSVSYQTQQLVKASTYKAIKRKDWERELIWTVLQPDFQGVIGDDRFFEALKKIK